MMIDKNNLSKGWTIAKFKECCENISLNGIKIKQKQYLASGKFPVIDQGRELIGGYFNDELLVVPNEPPYIVFGDHTKIKKFVTFKFIAGADGVKVLKPYDFILPKLFYYFIYAVKTPDKGYARHYQFLSSAEFPIPPQNEQKRIIDKIEELITDLDKGIEYLETTKQQMKVYRQAVLKSAFEGKFTSELRERNSKLLKAEQLLEKVKLEKETILKSNKVNSKPIPVISKDELRELPKLPDTMAWLRLGDLLWSVKDGPHYSPKYQSEGIPFISGGNIRPNGIDFKNVKYISQELHNELSKRCKPEKGDVLYSKGGTTGIARVNSYDIDFNVWVHVAVLKAIPMVNPFYLQHALNSHHCYKQSQKYTHGVGNQDLGLTRMILITLPICSNEEQEEIVKEIESRLSVCDKIEEIIENSLQQAEALRLSIIKKAFEGKLVAQNPSDEPAEKLLERIRAAKGNGKPEKKVKVKAEKEVNATKKKALVNG
jgi:type I restriction enzyme S subunit